MRLVLTADTHLPVVPSRRRLPGALWEAIDAADVVVHAGDWMAPALLDEMEARAARLVGVWGNNDGDTLRARLPEVVRLDLDGVRMAVTHETGDARGRERRCDARFGPGSTDPVDVLVFGHSHVPWDRVTPSGLRLLNPGSPTERRRQPACTFMTGEVVDGLLHEVRRHDVHDGT